MATKENLGQRRHGTFGRKPLSQNSENKEKKPQCGCESTYSKVPIKDARQFGDIKEGSKDGNVSIGCVPTKSGNKESASGASRKPSKLKKISSIVGKVLRKDNPTDNIISNALLQNWVIHADEPMDVDHFGPAKFPESMDIDGHIDDSLCPEYTRCIYMHLQEIEKRWTLHTDYLSKSPTITAHKRAVLSDWLIQVQIHLDLHQETLHMAVALVDHFLARHSLTVGCMQLLGISALFVAAKYIERFPPPVATLVNLTDNAYSDDQVLEMEVLILEVLEWEITYPTSIVFLERYCHLNPHDDDAENMAKYMLDLQLINICFIEYPPSLLAASALCLSRQLFHESDTPWPSTLSGYTRYTERDLMEAMQKTAKTLQEAPNSFFQGTVNVYDSDSHGWTSKHPVLQNSQIIERLSRDVSVGSSRIENE